MSSVLVARTTRGHRSGILVCASVLALAWLVCSGTGDAKAQAEGSLRLGPSSPAEPEGQKLGPVLTGMNEARGLYRLGRVDEAVQKLRELHRAYPDEIGVTQSLGSLLEASGKGDEALNLYREAAARATNPGPDLVQVERLYREAQAWDRALDTCLEYRERLGSAGETWVNDEIESLIRADRIGDTAIRSLESAVRRRPEDGKLRELWVTALFHQGKTEKALEEAATLDKNLKANGTLLFRYARLADDKQSYSAALAAYDMVLQRDPPAQVKSEAQFRRAAALRHLGRLEEALTALRALGAGDGAYAFRARQDEAVLLSQELHRPEEALAALRTILDSLAGEKGEALSQVADETRLAMADCQLSLGRPADALGLYQELAEKAVDAAVRVQALFQVGEMLFYQGKLKEAQDAYYQVVDKYPQEADVNDALARILLLGEDSDNGGVPLTALAQSEYQRRLGNLQKGIKLVDDALAQYPDSRAADALHFQRTKLLLELGRSVEARAAVDTLAARFPNSPLAPRAYLAVAGQLQKSPAGDSDVQAIYTTILLRFPDSLEAPEARAALRALKERTRESSTRETRDPILRA
jgi:tetratricopeptide (TPR) repeat protein